MKFVGKRAEEHQTHLRKGNADMLAVAYHAIHTQHAVHWKPQIIGREVNDKKRKIREALLISRMGEEKLMNMDRG